MLRNFVEDSDDVIDDLANNRADVVRFVREAGETAEITATRREELAQQFERLPTFLGELDPTMVRLGQLADAQIPLLADLRSASDELNTFFTRLGPFADASRPAVRTLGDTSNAGRRAINESANEVRELEQVARGSGVLGEPLRQFLQTLDDRDRAITTDDRAAFTDPPSFDRESLNNRTNNNVRAARGFTGFEALMNFAFWQTLTTNSFDGVSHFLRILGVVDEDPNGPSCSPLRHRAARPRDDRSLQLLPRPEPARRRERDRNGGRRQLRPDEGPRRPGPRLHRQPERRRRVRPVAADTLGRGRLGRPGRGGRPGGRREGRRGGGPRVTRVQRRAAVQDPGPHRPLAP